MKAYCPKCNSEQEYVQLDGGLRCSHCYQSDHGTPPPQPPATDCPVTAINFSLSIAGIPVTGRLELERVVEDLRGPNPLMEVTVDDKGNMIKIRPVSPEEAPDGDPTP